MNEVEQTLNPAVAAVEAWRHTSHTRGMVSSRRQSSLRATSAEAPSLTLFALPKPFIGHIGVIQRNALRSWQQLAPQVEVILFGDEVGTADYARRCGFRHEPTMQLNEHGTPLLNEVFRRANELARGELVMYANSDILFTADLLQATSQMRACDFEHFLGIGRRWDIDVAEMVDFEQADWESRLRQRVAAVAQLAPVVCKDYFLFRRDQYASIPRFAVGRGNWDNWMVHAAHQQRWPVVDLTSAITAMHQNHGYGHLRQGRWEAYVKGAEAEENQRLAGGRHLVSGCASNWRLRQARLQRKRAPRSMVFLGDLPRFGQLLSDLWKSSK